MPTDFFFFCKILYLKLYVVRKHCRLLMKVVISAKNLLPNSTLNLGYAGRMSSWAVLSYFEMANNNSNFFKY